MSTVQTPIPLATNGVALGSASVLDQLSAWNVQIPDRKDVTRYLTKYPGTADVVPALSAEARRVFGLDIELSLEVYHDPEIVDEYLSLYVRQERYESDFMDKIAAIRDQFDEELLQPTGFLLMTTDFRRPRGAHGV